MHHNDYNAHRSLHESATANKRTAAMHAVGKRQQRRARRARRIMESCIAPGTGLGLIARGLGLWIAFASLIVATGNGGAP